MRTRVLGAEKRLGGELGGERGAGGGGRSGFEQSVRGARPSADSTLYRLRPPLPSVAQPQVINLKKRSGLSISGVLTACNLRVSL